MNKQKPKSTHQPFTKPFWRLTGSIALSFFILFAGIEVVETLTARQLCTDRITECIGLATADDVTFSDRTTPELPVVNNARLNITNNSTGKSYFVPLKTEREIKSFLENTPSDLEVCAVGVPYYSSGTIAGVSVVGCEQESNTCSAPVITQSDVTSVNGMFSINFDISLYENVTAHISGPVSSTSSSTNLSPVTHASFGPINWDIYISADCKADGNRYDSNTINRLGSSYGDGSGNASCDFIWIDGTDMPSNNTGYSYFYSKDSIVPFNELGSAGACNNSHYLSNNRWENYECKTIPASQDPGNDGQGAWIYTHGSGGTKSYHRYIDVASACANSVNSACYPLVYSQISNNYYSSSYDNARTHCATYINNKNDCLNDSNVWNQQGGENGAMVFAARPNIDYAYHTGINSHLLIDVNDIDNSGTTLPENCGADCQTIGAVCMWGGIDPDYTPPTYSWQITPSGVCTNGSQPVTAICVDSNGNTANDSNCPGTAPTSQTCITGS